MLIRPQARRQPRRRGAALIEFCGVLPLYLLLILGIWEGGRLFHALQIVSNATREGARLAARADASNDPYSNLPMSSPANVRATVINYIRNTDPGIGTGTGLTIELKKIHNGGEIPGAGSDVDPANKVLPLTDPLRVQRLDHLRVRVTIGYDNFRLSTNVPLILNVNQLVVVVDTRCLLDDPFTIDPTVPTW
jgi:Flp pilus assembly protein TadG